MDFKTKMESSLIKKKRVNILIIINSYNLIMNIISVLDKINLKLRFSIVDSGTQCLGTMQCGKYTDVIKGTQLYKYSPIDWLKQISGL
jgi:hypothetical protein